MEWLDKHEKNQDFQKDVMARLLSKLQGRSNERARGLEMGCKVLKLLGMSMDNGSTKA